MSPIVIERKRLRLTADEKGISISLEGYGRPVLEMNWEASEVVRPDDSTVEMRSGSIRRTFSVDESRVHVSVTRSTAGSLPRILDRWHYDLPGSAQSARVDGLDFAWTPQLTPETDDRIGAHTFRSPTVILFGGGAYAAIVPDISDQASRYWIADGVLNLDAPAREVAYGLEPTGPTRHVYFETDPSRSINPHRGEIRFAYDLLVDTAESRARVVREVCSFLWKRHTRSAAPAAAISPARLAPISYGTLFGRGEFVRLADGGGFRAESHHADYFRRPDPVVWNQTWFNGQRSAYGLAHFGLELGRDDWTDAARRITRTTLSAPDWAGLYPALFAFEEGTWWGSIPRLNGGAKRVQIADAASTGLWLLRFSKVFGQLLADERPEIDSRLARLARALIDLQQPDGSIPAWCDWDGDALQAAPELVQSAETAAGIMYLAEYAPRGPGHPKSVAAVEQGAGFLESEIMSEQRYQDFETFYSCSQKPLDFRDNRTGIPPQNSLAVYWTAAAMLGAYRLTGNTHYLELAGEAADLLSLYQQIWNPPFLSLETFGGFGVMNTDAEWSDARQSLFAPFYFEMHQETGNQEYLERGRAALSASFVLACVPEHERLNPKGFNQHPAGIMPENYGHSGQDLPSGRSDTCWGECGALSAAALIERRRS